MIWEASASTVSPAAPQAVWDVLIDGRRWSFWNPDVEWMWIEGDLAPGALATLKAKGLRQTAFTIQAVAPPQHFAMRVTFGPLAAMDVAWTLSALVDGTRIEQTIAISGIAAGLLLKKRAERVAAAMPRALEGLAQRAIAGA